MGCIQILWAVWCEVLTDCVQWSWCLCSGPSCLSCIHLCTWAVSDQCFFSLQQAPNCMFAITWRLPKWWAIEQLVHDFPQYLHAYSKIEMTVFMIDFRSTCPSTEIPNLRHCKQPIENTFGNVATLHAMHMAQLVWPRLPQEHVHAREAGRGQDFGVGHLVLSGDAEYLSEAPQVESWAFSPDDIVMSCCNRAGCWRHRHFMQPSWSLWSAQGLFMLNLWF